jgi:hypothetical protein
LLAIHSLLALALFLDIQHNPGAQAEFAWFFFMVADFPASYIAWEYVAHTPPFSALLEWGYSFGSGPNLRAFIIHLFFGGAQWFFLGWVAGFLFWPRYGWLAMRRAASLTLRSSGTAQKHAAP